MRPVEPSPYVSSAGLPVLIDVQAGATATSARIAVFGDLDHASAYPLERAVIHVLRERRPAHLEIDLADVPFLDTGGIKVLLHCRADARQLDCRLTLTHAQPLVYRVLEIVGLLQPLGMAAPTGPGTRLNGDRAHSRADLSPVPGEGHRLRPDVHADAGLQLHSRAGSDPAAP